MKKKKNFQMLINSILAGICIAVAGTIYLTLDNKVIGAILFSFGLITICIRNYDLFTGKVANILTEKVNYLINLGVILVGNFLGTFFIAFILKYTRVGDKLYTKANSLMDIKLNDDILSIFILAILCNMLIYLGVCSYKNCKEDFGKYLMLMFVVVIFILCSFEHCIANMFYINMSSSYTVKTLGYLIVMILGNSVGGIMVPLLERIRDDK